MDIITIDDRSPHLDTIKRLYRSNSSILGFFPDGAFADYAAHCHILIALDLEGKCIGYLMYRTSRYYISIVHLCVDSSQRRQGVAKALIDYLKKTTKQFQGIALRCRRDYEASKIWPHLGFVALSDRPGRSLSGESLTFWWLDHGHPSLFTYANQHLIQSKVRSVIDANIFFDLQGDTNPDNEESQSLLADWLQDNIVLCLTQEMFNEINRNPDPIERDRQRSFARRFPMLDCEIEKAQEINKQLRSFFPEKIEASDESDIRQLAYTIGASGHFFVTRDNELLKISDPICKTFGLLIIRPSNLIVHLDELVREAEYQPARLAGSRIKINLVKSGQDTHLADVFRYSTSKKSKATFQQQINHYLADPIRFKTCIVKDANENPLALIVYAKQRDDMLEIPIFRLMQGSSSSTLARYLLFQSIIISVNENRKLTKITDQELSEEIVRALQDNAFLPIKDGWVKFNFRVIEKAEQLMARLARLEVEFVNERDCIHNIYDSLKSGISKNDSHALLNIERCLWPAKIANLEIPAFIIPIQPKWAIHLFDENIAKQTLFGSEPEIALNLENVYYRAKHPTILSAPARILWYISHDKRYRESMHIRASSYIDEIIVGNPKDLFRMYRRLGVYKWEDVFKVAKNNMNNDIMVFLFSNTELLSSPIFWDDLQRILIEEDNCKSQLQSPIRISTKCFFRLYSLGVQINSQR